MHHFLTPRTGRCLRMLTLNLTLGLITLSAVHNSAAESKTTDHNARRVQLMQQQMQEQQAQWEGEKATLNKKLAEQDQELARVKTEQQKMLEVAKHLETIRAELGKSGSTIADLQKQLAVQKTASEDSAVKKDRELSQLGKTREQERVQWLARAEDQQKQLAQCSDKNQRLIKLGADLLTRYKNKNIADIALQNEPLLQFGDIELFNQVQDYRDKIDAERYDVVPANAASPDAATNR